MNEAPTPREIALWSAIPGALQRRILSGCGPVWLLMGERSEWAVWGNYGQTRQVHNRYVIPVDGLSLLIASGMFEGIDLRYVSAGASHDGEQGFQFYSSFKQSIDHYRQYSTERRTSSRRAALELISEVLSDAAARVGAGGAALDRLICALCITEISSAPPEFCPYCQELGERFSGTTLRRILSGEALPASDLPDRLSRLGSLIRQAAAVAPDDLSAVLAAVQVGE